jgi:hypothetical protein
MRNTTVGIFAALFIMALAFVMPVSAETLAIQSQLSPQFTMTVGVTDVQFPLTLIGENAITTTNMVTVTSNSAWTFKAKDSMLYSKLAGSGGKMGLLKGDGSAYFTPAVVLTNPLQMSLNSVYTPLAEADSTIHTGVAGVAFNNQPIKFKQVTTIADPATKAGNLATDSRYNINLIVTGAAVP